ncbi:MAG: 3-alpha domain-containing protein, partial [Planctomycetota bacterium]
WKLSERWQLPKLAVRVQQTRRTGWYLRVLRGGVLHPGQTLQLIDRPHPSVTVTHANDVLFAKPRCADADQKLADCDALSDAWKQTLRRRSSRSSS